CERLAPRCSRADRAVRDGRHPGRARARDRSGGRLMLATGLDQVTSWAVVLSLLVGFGLALWIMLRSPREPRDRTSETYPAAPRRAWDEQRWRQEERLRELYDQDQENP